MMEKRTLGRTGLNVAVVGFGTLPMGGFYGPVDDAVSIKALACSDRCRDEFYRHLRRLRCWTQ